MSLLLRHALHQTGIMLEVLVWVVQVLHIREEASAELSKHIQEAQRLQGESEADKVFPRHICDPSCVSTVMRIYGSHFSANRLNDDCT